MRLVIAILTPLLLTQCGKDETISGFVEPGQKFLLSQVNNQDIEFTFNLSFPEEGQISGQAPCNSFSASQSAPYPWLDIGPILSTKRACPDLNFEVDTLQLLARMTLVEVSGDTLILSNDAEESLLFMSEN